MSAFDELDRDPALEALVRLNQLRDFLATEQATLILRESADRARDAIVELLNCDPGDRAQIAAFQAQARVFHELQSIVAAITDRGEAVESSQANTAEDYI